MAFSSIPSFPVVGHFHSGIQIDVFLLAMFREWTEKCCMLTLRLYTVSFLNYYEVSNDVERERVARNMNEQFCRMNSLRQQIIA